MALLSERRYISPDDIESGMIVQFFYTKLNGERGQYKVLVVDPNRTNEHASEPQLHGYDIGELTDVDIIELASTFKTIINIDPETRDQPLVAGLDTDGAYEQFKQSRFISNRKYKTFNISKMSQTRQVLIGSPE